MCVCMRMRVCLCVVYVCVCVLSVKLYPSADSVPSVSNNRECAVAEIQEEDQFVTAGTPVGLTALMYNTLLPRMKASPYFFFNCPLTYSSLCSRAMFM
eukprot:m.20600 g.20600  ORF g.20600 m.20600 type:complete len:98 (+) comp12998_c0_seq1:1258-1551(+)